MHCGSKLLHCPLGSTQLATPLHYKPPACGELKMLICFWRLLFTSFSLCALWKVFVLMKGTMNFTAVSKEGCVASRGITAGVWWRLWLCRFVTNPGIRLRVSTRQSGDNFHGIWGSPSDSRTSQCLMAKLFLFPSAEQERQRGLLLGDNKLHDAGKPEIGISHTPYCPQVNSLGHIWPFISLLWFQTLHSLYFRLNKDSVKDPEKMKCR